MIGIYWILLYSLQIGLCLILVMARKDETKVSEYPLFWRDGLAQGLGAVIMSG
jgi:hypothetical protein